MSALPTSPPSNAGRPSASLHFVVGEMSGKLDNILASLLPQIADLKAADIELSSRVTTLERFQWGFLGIVSAGGVLWAVFQSLPHLLTLVQVAAK